MSSADTAIPCRLQRAHPGCGSEKRSVRLKEIPRPGFANPPRHVRSRLHLDHMQAVLLLLAAARGRRCKPHPAELFGAHGRIPRRDETTPRSAPNVPESSGTYALWT